MGYGHDGEVLRQTPERFTKQTFSFWIKGARRFVEQQKKWLMGQRARNSYTLPLPSG